MFGISRICFTILSLRTIKKFGRRSLILFGFFAAALIQLLYSLCFFVEEKFGVPYLPHSAVLGTGVNVLFYFVMAMIGGVYAFFFRKRNEK